MGAAHWSAKALSAGLHRMMGYTVASRNHAPFSATIKTSSEQTLPDGNHVRGASWSHEARDRAGHTMYGMAHGCVLEANGVAQQESSVSVYDRSTGANIHWMTGPSANKIARVFHEVVRTPAPAQSVTQEQLAAHKQAAAARQSPVHPDGEDLGTRTIAEVEAHGTRTTRTIAARA